MAEKSIIAESLDIIFIFVLAFACVVIPTISREPYLFPGEGEQGIGFVWDPVGFFSFLLAIVFFVVVLYHSVKRYKY